MKKNRLDKLVKQTLEALSTSQDPKWREDFIKGQLKIAYIEGKIDAIKEIRKRK